MKAIFLTASFVLFFASLAKSQTNNTIAKVISSDQFDQLTPQQQDSLRMAVIMDARKQLTTKCGADNQTLMVVPEEKIKITTPVSTEPEK